MINTVSEKIEKSDKLKTTSVASRMIVNSLNLGGQKENSNTSNVKNLENEEYDENDKSESEEDLLKKKKNRK